MRSLATFNRLFGSCAATALLAYAAPALAQEAEGEAMDGYEIIVTAQKRSERLQDVPVAVTSIGGDQLAAANINGASGLANVAPSLTFTQNTSPLNNNVRVRGIGTVLFSAGIESSVSFVVDGVVMARQGQGFTDLIDVERVEVLRGPQGTLFGKNATAGVINVVTQAPSDTFEGKAEATVAEMGEYRLRGTVSGPLSDGVRARLTGFYTKDESWARDAFRNKDVFGTEDFGLRAKVAIDVAPAFELMVTGDYRKSDSTCCQPLPFQTTLRPRGRILDRGRKSPRGLSRRRARGLDLAPGTNRPMGHVGQGFRRLARGRTTVPLSPRLGSSSARHAMRRVGDV